MGWIHSALKWASQTWLHALLIAATLLFITTEEHLITAAWALGAYGAASLVVTACAWVVRALRWAGGATKEAAAKVILTWKAIRHLSSEITRGQQANLTHILGTRSRYFWGHSDGFRLEELIDNGIIKKGKPWWNQDMNTNYLIPITIWWFLKFKTRKLTIKQPQGSSPWIKRNDWMRH